ncbi:MAG TPA: PAS domain S-box protein [Terriglobales bacterium]|jgi:PAS domain S-box-containing protein|nr:PAS domain S-box protein [Terriglobales bacterium]
MVEEDKPEGPSRPPGHLEKEEARLWRLALAFLVLLATGLAALSWERLENLPYHLGAIPIGLLVLAILFAAYAYGRRREVSELKHLLDDLHDRAGVAPSDQQLDQLSQVIQRSQRSFKELIDSFDDVAFACSLDGTLRTVNRRVTQMLGLSYQDIVGHKIDDFVQEPLRRDVEGGLLRFLEKRRWSGLVRVQLKDSGRALYFDCVLNAIVKGDEVVGISALARDVTEEREKERRFTELFETLQEGVYFSTPEGKLQDANPALIQMLGCDSREELLSLDPTSLRVDPNQGAVLGRTADDRGSERSRELMLRRKDGTTAVFLDRSRAVWDSAGKIIRYQGTLVDVTERRKMEKALRQQEEFQRYLLESFPDLILVIDLEGRYSFVSSRIRDLLGRVPADLLGRKVDDAEQEQSPEFQALYHDVSTGAKKFGFCEFGARHRDGSWRTMRANASPLFDAEGKSSGVIVSVRDITVEKKLEQQIIQSERLAAMGQMIGGFAHELNNPLTSIMGVAELLQEGEKEDSRRKHLVMLQQQGRRAADIVQNLMYFSRPPAPGRGPINLNELVQRTLHLHAYSLRKNNITVDFLPEASLPTVTGDSHQLMQVFLNLILNAEQAMRETRDRGTLRIRLEQGGKAVAVTFQDDGPGIAAEVLPNIFDPFYTTKRPGRGTGLGLSICKAILREHGGEIEASSGPGGGAVFKVTLPVQTPTPAAQSS